jgi:spore coat polysaccharide biosynthesis predicted glycosyltransferase SpsG/RimJ/RimL family protein N-acetyltransferase
MNVFILTEAGQKVGFGHLSRCSAVYHAFRQRGIKPTMIIRGDEGISRFLEGIDHDVFNWQESFQELLSRVAGADIVFIDSYLASEAMYQEIASIVTLVACMDDYKRISYPPGVVINGLIYAPSIKYPKTQGVDYLLGSRYALLRKAFWFVPVKKISAEIKNIFITFGGSDFLDLAPETVRLIAQKYPTIKKTVVVSRFYKNIEGIKKVADENTRVVIDASDVAMKRLMMRSDVAVSASGQTLSELAVLGVPGVAVYVVDNQRLNWSAWTKQGFIAAQPRAESVVKAFAKLQSSSARKPISKMLSKSISPLGVFKIVDTLMGKASQKKREEKRKAQHISLRTAQNSDCRDIWLWRNTHQARRASFQSEPIAYEQHERWFERKTKESQSILWIAQSGKDKIGHVRYEIDGDRAAISIVLNPRYYGMGLGGKVIRMADQKFVNTGKCSCVIHAEIQDHHLASVGAFVSAGYRLKERIIKNGKKAGVYQWSS